MILNLHEWWLLRTVGGYTLGKRSVPKDLAALFDKLVSPYDTPAHGVAYGNRRYR